MSRCPGTRLSSGARAVLITLGLIPAITGDVLAHDRSVAWEQLTRAVGQIVAGELESAVLTLRETRQEWPEPAEIDTIVGLAALAGNDVAAAEKMLSRAARNRGGAWAHYWAARTALKRKHAALAEQRAERAVAIGGDQPVLLIGLALSSLAAGHTQAATATLERAARLWPNLLDPRLYPSPQAGAIELLGSLLGDFPDRLAVWRTQAHLHWQIGDVLAARTGFEKILDQHERDADALQMLARCAMALDRPEQAFQRVRRALSAAPLNPEALATYGDLLVQRDRAQQAIEPLQHAVDARPDNAVLLLRLAQACARVDRGDCAKRYFRWAARRNPRLAAAYLGLGLALYQDGKLLQAADSLAQALALSPTSAAAYSAAAQVLRQLGRRSAARRLLSRAAVARRIEQRFAQRVKHAQRASNIMLEALRACGCEHGPCVHGTTATCQQATSRVAEPARSFLRAHLALRTGATSQAERWIAAITPRLSASVFEAKRIVEQRGRAPGGQRYQLTEGVVMLATSQLQRATTGAPIPRKASTAEQPR